MSDINIIFDENGNSLKSIFENIIFQVYEKEVLDKE